MFSGLKPCLLRIGLDLAILLLQGAVLALLAYALIIGAGDITVSGCRKVGFYNYCFFNQTLEFCECLTSLEELSVAGVASHYGLLLAIILTYFPLVLAGFALLAVALALWLEDATLLKFAQVLNLLSLAALSLGVTIYLSLTWDLIDISHMTLGFLALLAAIAILPGLCLIIRRSSDRARGFTNSKTGSATQLV